MSETTVAIHSPQDQKTGSIVQLSKHGKVWRKQILPLGAINYNGRQIKFDSEYHKTLVRNFRAGAYPQVPFQLADASNTHTNDPERTRGEMVDLRAEPTGLYGYFKLTDPTVVLNNQKLGVSCRIVENYARESDGKQFGHSLQHVLGTLDPRVTGMKPWESVELSSGQTDSTIDLSGQFYTKDGGEMPAEKTEDKHVVELSTAQLERLNKFLESEESEDEKPGDEEEFDFSGFEDPEDEDEDDSDRDDGDSLALAQVEHLRSQVLELTNKLDGRDAQFELEQLAATGLAPAIIEAARPLLQIGSGTIDLANGSKVSPSEQVRTLLRTVLELSNQGLSVVIPDQEIGSLEGETGSAGVRKAMLDELDEKYGS